MKITATQTIELPENIAAMLQAEARRSRKSVSNYIGQWLQDQADGREAARVLRRIEAGKEKLVPAEEVYAKLGL